MNGVEFDLEPSTKDQQGNNKYSFYICLEVRDIGMTFDAYLPIYVQCTLCVNNAALL
jgi:hypothetical protein